jgi:predicted DNA-binding transcriptional regulator YafY
MITLISWKGFINIMILSRVCLENPFTWIKEGCNLNRTANALKMLQILSSGRQYSKRELADLIGTKERNIYELKKELEDAGYSFKELKGKYSGYALEKKDLLCIPKFSSDEITFLRDFNERISSNNKVIGNQTAAEMINKILSITEGFGSADKSLAVHSSHQAMEDQVLEHHYRKLKQATVEHKKIKGRYASYSSTRVRSIYPYDLVSVDDEWYCIGFDPDDQIFKTFKLSRFLDVEILDELYWVDPKYRRKDFVDDYGLKKIGKPVRLVLNITGPYKKTLMEKPVGENVEIQDYGNFMRYAATLRGEYKIREFILMMGWFCEIESPVELKETFKKEYQYLLKDYR